MGRKTAPVIFAAALAVLLTCCGRGEAGPPVSSFVTDVPSSPEDTEKNVSYAELDGFSGYCVVKPGGASATVSAAASEAAGAICLLSGSPDVRTDREKTSETEVLVGNVKREGVSELFKALRSSRNGRWYHIGLTGGRIIILGSDEEALYCGARRFASLCLGGSEDGKIMIPENGTFDCGSISPSVVSITEKNMPVTFAAEVNLGLEPWFADGTGRQDMTAVIQRALDYVRSIGGGTVFLPAGRYLVTSSLTVDTAVTLRGVYADPDFQEFSDGTSLLLDPKGAKKSACAVNLAQNAAVQGITFEYAEQDLTDEYGFTLRGDGNAFTVRDCTLLGSWDGISSGKKAVGMVTIENVRGTVLHTGIEAEQHADICVMTDVSFSPSYLAKIGRFTEREIREAMAENGSAGLRLGDVDRDTFENILLDGFETGIFNRSATRAGCSGSFYSLTVTGCRTGIEAHGLSTAYGICIAGGRITADETAVLNLSPSAGNAVVNAVNVSVSGEISGRVNMITDEKLSELSPLRSRAVPSAPARLFNIVVYGADRTGKKDVSDALSSALNDAEKAGGGIVYIPAGLYLLEKPVTGGANVCIQGAHTGAQGATADFSGSVLLVRYGRGLNGNGQAAVTLNGDNSGITGLTVYYPDNGILNDMNGKSVVSYSPFLRCTGRNSFFTFSCLIAASRAADFDGADGFVADRLTGTFYDCGVSAKNCRGGLISRIHTNGTYLSGEKKDKTVLGEDWFSDTDRLYEAVIDGVLARRLVQVSAEDCTGLTVSHTFYYGGLNLISAEKSDITAVCCEGARTTAETFVLKGGCSLYVVICNRPNGNAYIRKTGGGNDAHMIMFNNSLTVYSGQA